MLVSLRDLWLLGGGSLALFFVRVTVARLKFFKLLEQQELFVLLLTVLQIQFFAFFNLLLLNLRLE